MIMNSTYSRPLIAELGTELTALRGNWLWFVLLGIALMVFGFIALGVVPIASLTTTVGIGALLLSSGVAEIIGAFWCRGWNGFLLHMLSGVLSGVVGGLFLPAPVDNSLAMTLLLACMLIVDGIFKMIAALRYRFETWGWVLASGIIDLMLGVIIWQEWPGSALWVIDLFVGISLLCRAFYWIGLGLTIWASPRTETS
jgi:uncharacterized membrane protein HdeD (DUF308 family)